MNTVQQPSYDFSLTALMVFIIMISGCTSLHTVNIADEPGRNAVTTGDTVVVTTSNGQIHKFKVTGVSADGLHGKQLSIPYADMRLLQIQRIDMQKTILLTVGVIGLGAIANNSGGGSGGGGY